jgi:hypothetical protein
MRAPGVLRAMLFSAFTLATVVISVAAMTIIFFGTARRKRTVFVVLRDNYRFCVFHRFSSFRACTGKFISFNPFLLVISGQCENKKRYFVPFYLFDLSYNA